MNLKQSGNWGQSHDGDRLFRHNCGLFDPKSSQFLQSLQWWLDLLPLLSDGLGWKINIKKKCFVFSKLVMSHFINLSEGCYIPRLCRMVFWSSKCFTSNETHRIHSSCVSSESFTTRRVLAAPPKLFHFKKKKKRRRKK